ncbi:MAG: D-alanyl-D-alanine carboxypeptidase family protein [Rubricella sp.]
MTRVVAAVFAALSILALALPAAAVPYAAIVIDARDGDVLHSRNADARLHPASLTKMMTLYVAFEAIENGEIALDDIVRVSRNAASEPPSRLGLRSGQRISLRYLIRAAAIRSANDAATAIAEAISGSERAFAERMTQTARRMGMTNTTFRNAHGLTQQGHLSSARDMAILSRHIVYDYPQYYNVFGATSRHAGIATVRNTNRRLLNSYRGADGIKTGYTRAAGYNLSASAQRGQERIIAVVFGGRSSDWRYHRIVELLDMGFDRAPSRTAFVAPEMRDVGAVMTSFRPRPRGQADAPSTLVAAAQAVGNAIVPAANAALPPTEVLAGNSAAPRISAPPRPRTVGGVWAVQLGAYRQERTAEEILREVAMSQIEPLSNSLRQVQPTEVSGLSLYEARFTGLTEMQAVRTCATLQEQNRICRLVAPEG